MGIDGNSWKNFACSPNKKCDANIYWFMTNEGLFENACQEKFLTVRYL
jgi:hypothetical protein